MTGAASRLMFLQYGAERVRKSLSLRGDSDRLYWAPFIGVLVSTADGWILFDTGMSRATHDAPATERIYAGEDADSGEAVPWHLQPAPPDPARWTWGLSGSPVRAALATAGLAPDDLTLAIISHLHWDHSGGIPELAAANVPIAIHRDELAFARSGVVGPEDGFQAADWSEPAVEWHQLDGDTDLAPGVQAVATPGHTPGHLALRVDLQQTGTWIFTADATDLAQNLLDHVPCGSCASQTEEDEHRAETSLDRLLRLGAATGARLIPGHDQVVFNAVRHPPGGHR